MSEAPTDRPFAVTVAPQACRACAPTAVLQLFTAGARALARRLGSLGASAERLVEFAPKMCAFTATVRIDPRARTVSLLTIQPRATS